jgi:DNA-binding XRE family transcriptional regulator
MKKYESHVQGKGYNYKDQKDVGALKPKKRDLETELLQVIRGSANPVRAMVVATKLMADFLMLAELGEGGDNTFGNRLRMLREGAGITQERLAQTIGTSKSSINMYERGEREPGIETILAIANHFGVSTDYLLGRRS